MMAERVFACRASLAILRRRPVQSARPPALYRPRWMKNKIQSAVANVVPNEMLAKQHRKIADPGPPRSKMLNDEQIAVLCEISQSVAFSDDRHGLVQQLLIDGYVIKNGDLYELSAQGAGRRRRPSGSGARDWAVTCLAAGRRCSHTDRRPEAFRRPRCLLPADAKFQIFATKLGETSASRSLRLP